MRKHILLTNDFPPKVGGIQSYLWELWKRLPSENFFVYTTPFPNQNTFDSEQHFRIHRSSHEVLLPTPRMTKTARKLAKDFKADLIIWDPAFPLALSAPKSGIPYALILHGAELAIPGKLPIVRQRLAKVLRGSSLVICAGNYPAKEAELIARETLPVSVIPPGVDIERFRPGDFHDKAKQRNDLGLSNSSFVILAVTRLVPRKGMDVLIKAVKSLHEKHPDLSLLIAGTGRDKSRLQALTKGADGFIKFLGEVSDEKLPDLYRTADLFIMPCRSLWGGLEQEGFGIVFLEAAASGVPQIAGRSGGSADAVTHNETGLIVDDPTDPRQLARSIEELLKNPEKLRGMSENSRARVENYFSYDLLSKNLINALESATLK
ncbi:MAG: alpha-(1-2)-phosphatidylinositol mannosyltransferase [Acidimicrobiaceae bacterium]|nr:alpha-(1-2)-phosphatidylinositol mannosyltransferase [Acidimicrobiaceae bacterium]